MNRKNEMEGEKKEEEREKKTWLLPFLHPSVLMVQVELYSPLSACAWSRRRGEQEEKGGQREGVER